MCDSNADAKLEEFVWLFMMGKVLHTECLLCDHEDFVDHILGHWSHLGMQEQHIARHDKAAQVLLKAVINCT